MLLDIRTYRCKPGTIGKHLDLYESHGKPPQFRCLGEPVFYGKVETPDPNEYVHIWAYADAADRAARRAVLWADPEWLAYTKMSAELGALDSQTNKLVVSVGFDPLAAARG
ncbi:MAG: NIPSNAP family protein [Pseudomonadota bacterium]